MNQHKLILGTKSPRRREILTLLGLPFEVVEPAEGSEWVVEGFPIPDDVAQEAARRKAHQIAAEHSEGLILTADTIVVSNNRILGKPRDAHEANRMLKLLRERELHLVVTGVCLTNAATGQQRTGYELTQVFMRRYSDQEIAEYVASSDPLDKAGAYAIQHPGFHPVSQYKGCYLNVVGLPLCRIAELLEWPETSLVPENAHVGQLCTYCERYRANNSRSR